MIQFSLHNIFANGQRTPTNGQLRTKDWVKLHTGRVTVNSRQQLVNYARRDIEKKFDVS